MTVGEENGRRQHGVRRAAARIVGGRRHKVRRITRRGLATAARATDDNTLGNTQCCADAVHDVLGNGTMGKFVRDERPWVLKARYRRAAPPHGRARRRAGMIMLAITSLACQSQQPRGGEAVVEAFSGGPWDGLVRPHAEEEHGGVSLSRWEVPHCRWFREIARIGEATNPGPSEVAVGEAGHQAGVELLQAAESLHCSWRIWAANIRVRAFARRHGAAAPGLDWHVERAAEGATRAAAGLAQARSRWERAHPRSERGADEEVQTQRRMRRGATATDKEEDDTEQARDLKSRLARIGDAVNEIVRSGRPRPEDMITLRRLVQAAADSVNRGRESARDCLAPHAEGIASGGGLEGVIEPSGAVARARPPDDSSAAIHGGSPATRASNANPDRPASGARRHRRGSRSSTKPEYGQG